MRHALVLLAAVALLAGCAGKKDPEPVDPALLDTRTEFFEADFLKRSRQLTFEGIRASRGIFSPEGRSVVFQSERTPGVPFSQIYRMDLKSGEAWMLSPGHGRATWPRYSLDGRLLFASSHNDPDGGAKLRDAMANPELEPGMRANERLDEGFDLYAADAVTTGVLNRLTSALGFEGQAVASPSGKDLVFVSTAPAYRTYLSSTEARLLNETPIAFSDLYLSAPDGSGAVRLTETPGEDTDPAFEPQSGRILWRHRAAGAATATLMTMESDGSGRRVALPGWDVLGPAVAHPSGEYLMLALRRDAAGDWELYLTDPAITKEPVRVTFTKGADAYPNFSPDGQQLLWTSDRHAELPGQGEQLYLADWDHQAARRALSLAPKVGEIPEGTPAEAAAPSDAPPTASSVSPNPSL